MRAVSTAERPPRAQPNAPSNHGVTFWLGVAAGWSIIGFGIHGFLRDHRSTHPGYALRWLIEFALLQDLFVSPIIAVVGYLLGRFLPRGPIRAVIQGALIISAVVTLTAWPVLRGYGRDGRLPSLLPLNYATGLATVLGIVWASAAVILVVRLLRLRAREKTEQLHIPDGHS